MAQIILILFLLPYQNGKELKNDDTVKVAGSNGWGQLGTIINSGTTNPNPIPFTVSSWNGAKECYVAGHATICIMSDGTVKGSGSNLYGQLGTTVNSGLSVANPTPLLISGLKGAKQCVLTTNSNRCIIELPCNSEIDTFSKTYYGTLYVCKNNIWTEK